MGNSEVGHNALGSGQIYSQGAKLVNESLDSGDFFQTNVWKKYVAPLRESFNSVHFLGLLSDGNIHSNIQQLFKMVDGCVKDGIKNINFHILLDGRDVAPTSGLIYVSMLEKKCVELKSHGVNAQIASGGGRMGVTMDRYYSNWSVVKTGWDAHVLGIVQPEGEYKGCYTNATEAIEHARSLFPERQDQFNPAFVIVDSNGNPVGKMSNGDVVINFNFRGDRAIQISEAFENDNFDAFDRGERPDVKYIGLLEYDGDRHLPKDYLVPPPLIENVSSLYLCNEGVRSFAVSETHKYGHVTYFWNGNRSGYIDESLEDFMEIKSDPNEMIEGHPEMKAREVADAIIEAIRSSKYDYIRANIANGDMVGHTGNYESCKKSVKVLEQELKRIVDTVLDKDGVILITADHGNIEQELDKNGNPLTSHTLNKVPCLIIENNPYYKIIEGADWGIANVIATVMNLMGFKAPEFYEPTLIEIND
jgi:2,3-bisphosphoglycerate-independent phosphoglycerate mutase